jgi:hypothetical protein
MTGLRLTAHVAGVDHPVLGLNSKIGGSRPQGDIMCKAFASQASARALRLNGFCTSICLEDCDEGAAQFNAVRRAAAGRDRRPGVRVSGLRYPRNQELHARPVATALPKQM